MTLTPILAYIDPGSLGTILYSTALSFGLGILFFFRTLKQKARALFDRRPAADGDEE